MIKILTTIFTFWIISQNLLMAQQNHERCGTDHYHATQMENPDYAERYHQNLINLNLYLKNKPAHSKMDCDEILFLPVAVHYQDVGIDIDCAIEMALDQIETLNQDFAGTNPDIDTWNNLRPQIWPAIQNEESCIQFCLASLNHPSGYGLSDGDYAVTLNQTTEENLPDWANYLNFYVRDMDNPLGYSPLGGSGNGDGVTCGIPYFSSVSCGGNTISATYNMGRTITHEVGHYLNLRHPFDVDGSGCADANNDMVDDTPRTDNPTFGCPTGELVNCTDPILWPSYMDYCDDACLFMFSAGQVERMEAHVNANLQNLLNNAVTTCQDAACINYRVQRSFENESCGGNDGQINLTATGGTEPYEYSISNGLNYQETGNFPNLSANGYAIIVNDGNGCTFEDSIYIERETARVNLVNSTNAFCGDNSGTLFVDVEYPGEFEYSLSGFAGWRDTSYFANLPPGSYIVNVRNDAGCTGTLPVVIGDNTDLNLIVRRVQDVNCPLFDNGRIESELGNGMPPFVYTLNDENASETGTYSELSPGQYILSVSDSRGCKLNYPFDIGVSYANIDAECPCQLFAPNAMTPDGDGLNDLFVVVPSCPITEYRIQIFDRWGSLVFESDDLDTRWNGGYEGYYVNPNVFYYRITYRWGEVRNASLELQVATGIINIVR